MDINTLQDIIIQGISANTPLLNDFSKGSVNYTLARGLAGGLLDLYQKLELLESNFILPRAEGIFLDQLGNSLGIKRLNGATSLGYVIAQNLESRIVNIPPSLVLTNSLTLQQYQVKETVSISIAAFSEERLAIESLEASEKANIPAGTNLINPDFPQVNFYVGSYKNINGEFTGDLTTGVNQESDNQYRERILTNIVNHTNNYTNLKNILLNQGDLSNVLFYSREPGTVEVWLKPKNSITTLRLNALQNIIQENIMIGVLPEAKILNPRKLSFKVKVYNFQLTQTDISNIRDYINIFINNLSYKESLVVVELEQYLRLKTNNIVEVIIPQEEIIIAEEAQCFDLNSLEVIYNV